MNCSTNEKVVDVGRLFVKTLETSVDRPEEVHRTGNSDPFKRVP